MTAIVTGGASGIGSAAAGRLRGAGHDVITWDLGGGDIACATARIVSQVPVRLTSITRFQSAGSCAISIPEAPIPAQATSRSGTPTLARV